MDFNENLNPEEEKQEILQEDTAEELSVDSELPEMAEQLPIVEEIPEELPLLRQNQ